MRPNECAGSPLSANHPGTRVTVVRPWFYTMPRCFAMFSQSGRTTSFFFFFFGSRSRMFEKTSPCVWKLGAAPPLPWGLFFCYVGAVVFSDHKHLRALFSPKPPWLLLDWREPQRGRARTTQRASDHKAKQIGGAPFYFSSASGEVT